MKKFVIGLLILASLGVQTKANIFKGKDEITLVGDRMEVNYDGLKCADNPVQLAFQLSF